MEILYYAWAHYGLPAIIVSVIVVLLTFGIKIPYKMLTSKIKDESLRKLANTPITLFPFGLGIACWLGYSCITHTAVSVDEFVIAGIVCGGVAVMIYVAFASKVEVAVRQAIDKTKTGKEIAEEVANEAKQATDTVEKVTEKAKSIIRNVFHKTEAEKPKSIADLTADELYEKYVQNHQKK